MPVLHVRAGRAGSAAPKRRRRTSRGGLQSSRSPAFERRRRWSRRRCPLPQLLADAHAARDPARLLRDELLGVALFAQRGLLGDELRDDRLDESAAIALACAGARSARAGVKSRPASRASAAVRTVRSSACAAFAAASGLGRLTLRRLALALWHQQLGANGGFDFARRSPGASRGSCARFPCPGRCARPCTRTRSRTSR